MAWCRVQMEADGTRHRPRTFWQHRGFPLPAFAGTTFAGMTVRGASAYHSPGAIRSNGPGMECKTWSLKPFVPNDGPSEEHLRRRQSRARMFGEDYF